MNWIRKEEKKGRGIKYKGRFDKSDIEITATESFVSLAFRVTGSRKYSFYLLDTGAAQELIDILRIAIRQHKQLKDGNPTMGFWQDPDCVKINGYDPEQDLFLRMGRKAHMDLRNIVDQVDFDLLDRRADQLGIPFDCIVEIVARGVGRFSPLQLDNILGIVITMPDECTNYALPTSERQAILLDYVQSQMQKLLEEERERRE